jgi:poly-gamma-glutamate synthesis protein (capsule biosynthesis protein)
MNRPPVTLLIGICLALPWTAAIGCGDDEPATTAATATTAPETATTGEAPGRDGNSGPAGGGSGESGEHAARRAVAGAEDAYRRYVEAINDRDGAALCALLPADALAELRPPVERDGCAATLAASIGYRDPRGYPVWERTTLTGFGAAELDRDGEGARLVAAIVTDFADRDEPSVEDDIAYLERSGGGWRLAKPSSAIYRAIGRPEPPPGAITPPAAARTEPGGAASLVSRVPAPSPDRGLRSFRGSVERLSPELRRRMSGVSWHRGCPVGLGDLRLLSATYLNFHRRSRQGRLVVNEDYARGMLRVLKRIYAKRFPIRRMVLIDRYGADDHRSMRDDNTSAFNCRFVNGTNRWSMHAYGRAIDINPRENPYVSGGFVSPPEGRPYADRSDRRKGMLYRRGSVARAMKRIIGWEWAGDWPGARDYQHFSSNGS